MRPGGQVPRTFGGKHRTGLERPKQACDAGLRKLVDGVSALSLATPSKYVQKYLHLLAKLAGLGIVNLPEDLMTEAFPTPTPLLGSLLRQVENVVPPHLPIQVVYVQPVAHGDEPSRHAP